MAKMASYSKLLVVLVSFWARQAAALLCGTTDSPREAAVRSQRPSKSRAAMARVRARGNALKKAVYAFKH